MTFNFSTYEGRQKFLHCKIWRVTSINKMYQNPWCELCSKPEKPVYAQEVDHIIPLEEITKGLTGDDAIQAACASSNLQSLCKTCHSRKTYEEKLRGNKKKTTELKPLRKKWKLN